MNLICSLCRLRSRNFKTNRFSKDWPKKSLNWKRQSTSSKKIMKRNYLKLSLLTDKS